MFADEIKKSIVAAEEERNALIERLKDYDQIRARINNLEAFIKTGRELIGVEPKQECTTQTMLIPEVENVIPPTVQEVPQIDAIITIIRESGRSLSFSEIVEGFRNRKWKLSENNAVEVIRNVIKKNMNLFTREERKEGRVYRAYFGLKTSSEVSPV